MHDTELKTAARNMLNANGGAGYSIYLDDDDIADVIDAGFLCDDPTEYMMLAMRSNMNIVDKASIIRASDAVKLINTTTRECEMDAISIAREIMPFMTGDELWSVFQPNSYFEAELIGNDIATLIMSYVEINPATRGRIPMLIISEMIDNPDISTSCPVVRGFLSALEVMAA